MLAPFTAGWETTETNPLVIHKYEGCYVYDVDGHKYLDSLAGLWCNALGGNEPRLVAAATAQLNKLPFYHSFWNKTTKLYLIGWIYGSVTEDILTSKFIIPKVSFPCFSTGILEMRWSGVGIDEWWRNEQFWVIGGVSAHLFAVCQGLLKVLAGIDTNFTLTSKASDEEGDYTELYMFKWATLLIPPTILLIINLVGVVAGISNAINSGFQSWGPLFGKLLFALWVIFYHSLFF